RAPSGVRRGQTSAARLRKSSTVRGEVAHEWPAAKPAGIKDRFRSKAMSFFDRTDAGRQLAVPLMRYTRRSDVVLLALPRGGVPVAYEVAQALGAPLDVFLVRKLGVPEHPELAMGAIAEGGVEVLNDDLIRDLGIPPKLVQQVAVRERLELDRRDA